MQYKGWTVVCAHDSWLAWKRWKALKAATEEELQEQIDQREEGE